MIKIDTTGLKKLEKNLKSVDGTHNYELQEILNPTFISKVSKYSNVEDFLGACGIKTADDFKAFPQDKFDDFVKENTKFKNWEEMITEASQELIAKKLFSF